MLLLIGRCIIVCTVTIRLWRPSEAVQRFESLLFYQITVSACIMCLAVFLSGSISLAFSHSLSLYLVCIVHIKLFLYNLDTLCHIIAIIQCQDIYPSHLFNKTKYAHANTKHLGLRVSSTTGTSQLKIMRKLDCSLHQMHSKRFHNDTHVPSRG